MPAPRFNQEAARQARPVILLPTHAATIAQPPRRIKAHRLLPLTFIIGAALIGAATSSVLLRLYRKSATRSPSALTSSTAPNQVNTPFKLASKESATLEALPSDVKPLTSVAVGPAKTPATSVPDSMNEAKLTEINSGASMPRVVTTSISSKTKSTAAPSREAMLETRRVPSVPIVRETPRKQEARPARPAESVAAVGAVRRRTIETASKEGQINDDKQKKQNREKNERDEAALPPHAQDAGAIRRVRELFEGQPNRRSTARPGVDRVTAIFEGGRQQQ